MEKIATISLPVSGVTPFLFNLLYPNLESQTRDVIKTVLPLLIILPLVHSSKPVCGHVLCAAAQANYAFRVHLSAQWLFSVPLTALLVRV